MKKIKGEEIRNREENKGLGFITDLFQFCFSQQPTPTPSIDQEPRKINKSIKQIIYVLLVQCTPLYDTHLSEKMDLCLAFGVSPF